MNKNRIIFSSVCVILLIALIGGTFAWFYMNEEVAIGYGNSIFCEAGDSLEIALVKDGVTSKWSSSIDCSSGSFTTVDITGNGFNLYRPTDIDENQQPLNFITATSSNENDKNYDYIEFEVAFRSLSKMNVYLSDESFILPVDPSSKSNIYGDFSRDYIAGAMRVAVVDESGLRMIWAPNSQYQLIQNGDGTYAFNSGEKNDSVRESTYYYYAEDENGTLVKQKVSSDAYASKQFVIDSTGAGKNHTGNSAALVSLVPEREGVHACKTVKIRIWFEGTDREAHQALAGGNVNVKLKFIGVAKETDEVKQQEIDSITFDESNLTLNGMRNGMVFSTDGRNWTEYDSEVFNMPILESGDSIYIKYPETNTHYETNYKKFVKN